MKASIFRRLQPARAEAVDVFVDEDVAEDVDINIVLDDDVDVVVSPPGGTRPAVAGPDEGGRRRGRSGAWVVCRSGHSPKA